MTSLAARLGKVTTGLTGRERAMLVLKALAAGEEPDPQLRVIDDPVQRRAFDLCMGYINAANSELQSITHNLLYHAVWLEDFSALKLLHEGASLLSQQTGETADPKKTKRPKSLSGPEILFGVAEEMRGQLLDLVMVLCQEFAAVELVRGELQAEFDDIDLLAPEVREEIVELQSRLVHLLASLDGPAAFPEPDEERVEQTRARLEHVFKYWRLIEVRQ